MSAQIYCIAIRPVCAISQSITLCAPFTMSSDSLDALRKRNLELETANQSKELDIQMRK
jgi:hypothetical protein